ncbi:MAG TPA: sensor domain-containing diguanylate cyclase [Deltaproteobacteria bacterium]|nr:sensor domain-containing diguanylate cyclase [Deltaproteobacteria bacterium]
MGEAGKTRRELLEEVSRLTRRVAELEKAAEGYRLANQRLHYLVQGTSSHHSEDFLNNLTKSLASALGVRYAFIAKLAAGRKGKRCRIISLWTGRDWGEGFEYDTEGTPCGLVVDGEAVHFSSAVARAFPNDRWLSDNGIESYRAIPLKGPDGVIVGHMAVMDTRPMSAAPDAESLLNVFAARAASELIHMEDDRRIQESERRLRAIFNSIVDGVITINDDLTIETLNPSAEEMFGYDPGELPGRDIRLLIPGFYLSRGGVPYHLTYNVSRIIDKSCETTGVRKDGSTFPIELGIDRMEGGERLRFVFSVRDITARKETEEALMLFHRFVDTAGEGLVISTLDGRIKYMNPALARMIGVEKPEEATGDFFLSFYPPELRGHVEDSVVPAVLERGQWTGELELVSGSGESIPTFESFFLMRDKIGSPMYLAQVITDITERKRMESEIKKQAVTDPLTGAFNRGEFNRIMEAEVERVRRYGRRLSLIMFDIDHFKAVNDTFGHMAGDRALKTVADIARATLRRSDSLTRWGGEEFVIVAPETGLQEAVRLAERVRGRIEAGPFEEIPGLTASFGVAELEDGDTIDTFITRTDNALYDAKKKGRNRVETAGRRDP